VYLAKYLGVEDFGKYNFVFAYLTFFGIITDLGLGEILVREMSRDNENIPKMILNVHLIKLILSFIAIMFVILITAFSNYSVDVRTYIYIASITLLFQSFSDTYRTLFQTLLKMEYDVISKLIFKIISTILIFYIITVNGTLLQVILAITFSEFLRTLLNYIFSKKLVKTKFEIDLALWINLFKESAPIALSGIFLVLFHRIDVLMLSSMKGDLAVGLYSAAYKLSEPLGLIPYAFVASLFPIMSKYFISSKDTLIKSYEIGFKSIIILMLPIAVGTTLISDRIILLVYDQSYYPSTTALQILIWSLFFASINYLLTSLLTSIDKQRLTTFSMAVCVVANITMNYILIPQFSYNGASVATVATEIILLGMISYFASSSFNIFPMYKALIKPLEACLIMSLFVYYSNYLINANLFFTIASATFIYSFALIGLKTFSNDEITIMKKIIRI
jgi:O-antigen/teichoic acid export membrane protein